MEPDIETHPFPPFIPPRAKVLIMGTFPPKAVRWSMEFYYPNRINDFWRVMGLVLQGDPGHFIGPDKQFRLEDIKRELTDRGIALHDTGRQVRRLRDNASDKYLEIVTPVDLGGLLEAMPECRAIATTGQKAAEVIAEITGTEVPRMGECVQADYEGRSLQIWRMPSTSRAYPLALDKKADHYRRMLHGAGIL